MGYVAVTHMTHYTNTRAHTRARDFSEKCVMCVTAS